VINPAEIVDALVVLLRGIPELVDSVGGDEEKIFAYVDQYPQNVNLPRAIHVMPSPAVMVAYQDWGEGSFGAGQPINHRLTIYVRPAVESSYSDMTAILVNGIPSGQPLSLINATIKDGLDPMKIEGRCGRQLDAEGVEFWELNISFNEKWG
jgi:hypothetical protein